MATKVNIYKSDGAWCFAAWVDVEFDTSDTLDIADDATDEAAAEAAKSIYPLAEVRRVDDI